MKTIGITCDSAKTPAALRRGIARAVAGMKSGDRLHLASSTHRASELCEMLKAHGLWSFGTSDTPTGARVVAKRIVPLDPGRPDLVGPVGTTWPESRNA